MSRTTLGLMMAAFITVTSCLAFWFWRPAPAAAGIAPAEEIMYVCRETRVVSRGPRQPMPAINPRTGRATLVQALYCATCRQWYPAPPQAALERLPGGPVCPITGTPLLENVPSTDTVSSRKAP